MKLTKHAAVCNEDLLDALNALAALSLARDMESEAKLILEAVRSWRPDADTVRVLDAWIAMRNDDLPGARRLLMELHERGTAASGGMWTALLATCLYLQEDPSWRGYADEVIAADGDEIAVRFSKLLCGY